MNNQTNNKTIVKIIHPFEVSRLRNALFTSETDACMFEVNSLLPTLVTVPLNPFRKKCCFFFLKFASSW